MSQLRSLAIDLAYRPESYFWAYDTNIKLASDIKGAERKAMYERALRSGDIELANSIISVPELTNEERKAQSGIHPAWMGGEYLPNREAQEVEIARITIASTTQDVTCVYAKRGSSRIHYRVVDEYENMTLDERTRTSLRPLTLIELFDFFIKGWDLFCCLEANFGDHGYNREEVQGFIVDASSSFYAEFGDLVTQRVDTWVDQRREERGLNEFNSDDDEDDDQLGSDHD
jgi:hypothetical protein